MPIVILHYIDNILYMIVVSFCLLHDLFFCKGSGDVFKYFLTCFSMILNIIKLHQYTKDLNSKCIPWGALYTNSHPVSQRCHKKTKAPARMLLGTGKFEASSNRCQKASERGGAGRAG